LQTAPIVPWIEFFFPSLSLRIPTAEGAELESATISVAPGATLLALLRLTTYGLFFLLVLQVGTSRQRKRFLLHAALAITTIYAIFGIVSLVQLGDTILGLPKWAYEGFATGTFVNRNSFATFLAFGAVVAASLLSAGMVRMEEDGHVRRRSLDIMPLLYAVCLAIISVALLATQSRMGIFAAVAGCVLVTAINAMASPNRLLGVLALIVVLAGGAVAGVHLYGTGLLERLGSVEQSADIRLALYQQVVAMIFERPWFGYGGGTFELAYPLFHQLPVSPDLVWDRAHSTYLALWSDYGLVAGSIPLLLTMLATARIAGGMHRARSDRAARVVALGAVAVAGIHSLVDFSLEIQANAMLFLLLLAAGMSGVARDVTGK
jgi:O-antigen ligase